MSHSARTSDVQHVANVMHTSCIRTPASLQEDAGMVSSKACEKDVTLDREHQYFDVQSHKG